MEFEFAKNPTVVSLETVPEQFRPFYADTGEGFALADTYKGTATAIDGLNRSLKAARRDADEAKKNRPDVSAYAELGQLLGLEENTTDPVALKDAMENILKQSKDGQVNWEKMKTQLKAGYEQQLGSKDKEVQGMRATLEKHLIGSEAVRAIAAAKGVPELLLPHIQAKTKVIQDGDSYVVRVLDEAGDPRGNASGGFMTVEDLVKEMKGSPVFGRAFESEAPQGNNTKPNTSSQRPAAQQQAKTAMDKIKAGLSKRT